MFETQAVIRPHAPQEIDAQLPFTRVLVRGNDIQHAVAIPVHRVQITMCRHGTSIHGTKSFTGFHLRFRIPPRMQERPIHMIKEFPPPETRFRFSTCVQCHPVATATTYEQIQQTVPVEIGQTGG